MSPLPRELVRWLQTLDLPLAIKQPKRDLSNGYLIAEMCARYWAGFEMHSFENRLGRPNKEANWKVLRKYFAKNKFLVDDALIEGVIDCVDGAAERFLFTLYTALTKRELQMFAPSNEPEIDQVPIFNTMSSARQQQAQQQAQKSQEEAEKAAEAERKRLEAERLKAAQQRQQKPKASMKAHAIEAVGEEDSGSSTGIKFATATVKPLPSQLFARFGMRGGAADGASNGAGAGSGAPGAGGGAAVLATSGVVTKLSNVIATCLQEANAAPFQPTSICPTVADVFFRNVYTLEPSVRAVVWSALHQHVEEFAERLIQRPLEVQSILAMLGALFSPVGQQTFFAAVQVFSVEPTNTQAHQTLDTMTKGLSWWGSLFGILYAGSPAAAGFILKNYILPFLLPLRSATVTAESAEVLAQLVMPFTDCNTQTADTTMPPFFSAVYDWMVAEAPTADSNITANSSQRRSATPRAGFLLFLTAFNRLALRQARGGENNNSSHFLVEHELAVLHRTNQYHVTAALVDASPSDRYAAMKLLASLAECGSWTLLIEHYPQFAVQFTDGSAAWIRNSDAVFTFVRQTNALSKLLLCSGGSHAVESEKLITVRDAVHQVVLFVSANLGDNVRFPRWKHRVALLHSILMHCHLNNDSSNNTQLASDILSYIINRFNQRQQQQNENENKEWECIEMMLFSGSAVDPNNAPTRVTLHQSPLSGQFLFVVSPSHSALVPLAQGASSCITALEVVNCFFPIANALGRLIEVWRADQVAAASEASPAIRDLILLPSESMSQSIPRVATSVLKLNEEEASAGAFQLLVSRLWWLRRVVLGSNQPLVPLPSVSAEKARKATLQHLDAFYSGSTASSVQDDDAGDDGSDGTAAVMDGWWSLMRQVDGYISAALYTGELLAGQLAAAQSHAPKPPGRSGPSTAVVPPNAQVQQGVMEMAACAQSCIVRWYCELSGNNVDHMDDPQQAIPKAVEWFQNVVPSRN